MRHLIWIIGFIIGTIGCCIIPDNRTTIGVLLIILGLIIIGGSKKS
jgi:hypothetical protein